MRRRGLAGLLFAATLVCWFVPPVGAGTPDWLRPLVRSQLPAYPAETPAVVLLKEETIVVQSNGEIQTTRRRVVKILRPKGESEGKVAIAFDKQTPINSLKGWSITAQNQEYEVKEKDAIETALLQESLYDDARHKLLQIPGTITGSVVAYECEQKDRAAMYQHTWWLEEDIPVLTAKYTIQLPAGWEYSVVWQNHPEQQSSQTGPNQWSWEFHALAAIEDEVRMPDWRAVTGRMAVNFFPAGQAHGRAQRSWNEVGAWYANLASGRAEPNDEIRAKARELAAGKADLLDKVRAVTHFVQADIRYVAIVVGVGGYQPHPAPTIFTSRYGDCKDKVTLLGAMLAELGVKWYYVLVHSERGVVVPGFPSMGFNHVIAAVALEQKLPDGFATCDHSKLGTLVLFDPTDRDTPFGWLPDNEQASYALLVAADGGELIQLPVAQPNMNRLSREARFDLNQDGTLAGTVKEIRSGQPATDQRGRWIEARAEADRRKMIEDNLSRSLPIFRLESLAAEGLSASDSLFQLDYKLTSERYAKKLGNLMLVRPRVIGSKAPGMDEKMSRKYPIEIGATGAQTDVVEIAIPEGYVVDELPAGVNAVYPFAEYHSKISVQGKALRYEREFTVKQVEIPAAQLGDLKNLSGQILADEANSAVLKRQ